MVHVRVEHRACGESYAPPVRQFACERQSGAASSLVSDNGDIGELHHGVDEVIGRAVGTAVGQYGCLLLPTDTAGRFDIDCCRVREVTMSRSCLVGDVSDEDFLVSESGCELARGREFSPSVASDIDYDSVTERHSQERCAEVSVANGIREAFNVDVSDVVLKDLPRNAGRDDIVVAQVIALNAVAEVGGIGREPCPIL